MGSIKVGLKDYRKIIGDGAVAAIQSKAERLSDKHILCISSTYQGGGVAEILNSLLLLLNQSGVKSGWRILHGSPDFFTVTKKFHNALQGEEIHLTGKKKELYYDTNRRFSIFTHIDHDLVFVHDPQPLPLIDFYRKSQPWIFRCHIDISNPNPRVWDYLKGFIEKYDRFVVSNEAYKKEMKMPQSVVCPAIDPLDPKNRPVREGTVWKCLGMHGIDRGKPIISQVSRFDKWKDPLGVIKVFESVRDKADCRLVLLGSLALDDPEGQRIFERVRAKAEKSRHRNDIKLILAENDFLVNCLQKASSVVMQKSLREGFGLTVSEALYKGTPVVASAVGGIPLQVVDGVNGFLHEPANVRGFSGSVLKLLGDDKLRLELGKNGTEHVKRNFLITRLMSDWLDLFWLHLGAKPA
jgi:trehalose synthase